MKTKRDEPQYTLTDHLCRFCGTGRVLRQVNGGPTGGGNPIYRCSTCGKGGANMGPTNVCHCGRTEYRGDPCDAMCVPTVDMTEENMAGWTTLLQHHGLAVLWRRLC